MFSYSSDYGNSWTTPTEISGKSEDLCPITFSSRTDFSCDESQFNTFSPARVQVPVLLVQGERDTQAPVAIGAKRFARFATPDKGWIILPGADHAAHLEKSAAELARTVLWFTQRHDTGRL